MAIIRGTQRRSFDIFPTLKEARESAEQEAICNALQFCRGNKQKAADLLGIRRLSLKYNILSLLLTCSPLQ
ncbi:helix-turn-helix domain-containing protein [Syntrophomonas palmitatica]|uniref:helix-turn-helix domain-containing protein n=1 Tax=Syntrophomonas palmitatica TaxID=402877 RepID=UPI0006D1E9F0